MFKLQVDEETAKQMMETAINEKVEELARERFFMTYSDLCAYLNLSRPVIDEKLVKNGLRYFKQGNKYLFRKQDVDNFLEEIIAEMDNTNNNFKFYERLKK